MKRLRFGTYFQEEWNYPHEMGVGLEFCGIPTDKIKFIDILQDASCNPIASRRILEVLEKGETKQVTVMSGLYFDDIGDSLKSIGVEMKIIAPYNYAHQKDIENNARMDYVALNAIQGKENNEYLSNLSAEQIEEVKKRIVKTRESLKKLPHHFGRYN